MGRMVRWIKCIFKDCAAEDAVKDHESAELYRTEKKKEQEQERQKQEQQRQ